MSDLAIIVGIVGAALLFCAARPRREPAPPVHWAHYKYTPFGETTRRPPPPHEVTPAEAPGGSGQEVTP